MAATASAKFQFSVTNSYPAGSQRSRESKLQSDLSATTTLNDAASGAGKINAVSYNMTTVAAGSGSATKFVIDLNAVDALDSSASDPTTINLTSVRGIYSHFASGGATYVKIGDSASNGFETKYLNVSSGSGAYFLYPTSTFVFENKLGTTGSTTTSAKNLSFDCGSFSSPSTVVKTIVVGFKAV